MNQAVRRNPERFPKRFCFQLNPAEKKEVITSCDHLRNLRFAKGLPLVFTEHGVLMAATVLSSPEAVKMSLFIIEAFIRLREERTANAAMLKRLAEIDKTLLAHNGALREIYEKLRPLLAPPPEPPKRQIGFHFREQTAPYRLRREVRPER